MNRGNANAKDIRTEMIADKMRQCQSRDFKMWYHYRSVLQGMDPHNPQLELGFHGLPFFGHCID